MGLSNQGGHPPHKLQFAGHALFIGDGQDGSSRAELAHVVSCGTAFGEGQDGSRVELACDRAHCTADGVWHRARQMAIDRPLRVILLDPSRDGGHGLHSLHREVAHRRFVRQHDGIGAIENRVGHITHLSPGGARARSHRIEHLGGRDDRNTEAVGFLDEFLLKQRNFFGWHLNAEVATGNHHPIAKGKDGVDLINGFELLDLGHHRRGVTVLADQTTNLLHVGGVTHKAESDPINSLLKTKGKVSAVFVGKGPNRKLHVGEVHPLVVGQHTTNRDHAVEGLISFLNPFHLHFNAAVVQEDSAARGHLIRQLVVSDRGDLLIAGDSPRGQGERVSLGQGDGTISEAAKTNLWALKVLKNSDVLAKFSRDLTDCLDPLGVVAVIPVGKIQAKRGGASLDQFLQPLGAFGSRADGGHDLGSTGKIDLSHPPGWETQRNLPSRLVGPVLTTKCRSD